MFLHQANCSVIQACALKISNETIKEFFTTGTNNLEKILETFKDYYINGLQSIVPSYNLDITSLLECGGNVGNYAKVSSFVDIMDKLLDDVEYRTLNSSNQQNLATVLSEFVTIIDKLKLSSSVDFDCKEIQKQFWWRYSYGTYAAQYPLFQCPDIAIPAGNIESTDMNTLTSLQNKLKTMNEQLGCHFIYEAKIKHIAKRDVIPPVIACSGQTDERINNVSRYSKSN